MIRKIITFTFIVAVALFVVGCGGVSSEKTLSGGSGGVIDELTAGRIQGTVTASATGLPIANAVVEVGELQAVTDATGKYILGPIASGDYRVIVRVAGFELAYKDAVRVYQGKITENINFAMNPAGQSYSSDFSVIAVRPQMGTDGDTIDVYCNGCGTVPGKVTFNGKEARIVSWNASLDGRIVVLAPTDVESGPVRVYIDGKGSNENQLINFIARPFVAYVSPDIASGGSQVYVIGRNFNPIPSFNHVKLGTQDCFTESVTDNNTRLRIRIPVDARTGAITNEIRTDMYSLAGVGSATLTIIPKLVYMSPKRAVPTSGTVRPVLTIYGYNFGTDRNIVRVLFDDVEIPASEFLTFSDNVITLYAPNSSVVPPGVTAKVKVKVNQSMSNELEYKAYDVSEANLAYQSYGIYDFNALAPSGIFKLSTLSPNDRLIFISILSGSSIQSVSENNQFTFSSYMGGNYSEIPSLPTGNPSMRANNIYNGFVVKNYSKYKTSSSPSRKVSPNLRASLTEPATTTINIYVRNFKSEDPWDYENDVIATGTLVASGTKTVVYYDVNQSGLSVSDAKNMITNFENIYTKLKAEFGIAEPPEGNVDAQSRIALFVSPLLNVVATQTVMTYFDARDKNLSAFHSAGTEVIYVNSVGYLSNVNEFYASLAESLHQMFYLNQKSSAGVDYGTDWLKAGLGCVARDVAGFGLTAGNNEDRERISSYLAYPYKYGLNFWPASPEQGNYGMQHLFNLYISQRCSDCEPLLSLEGTSDGDNLHKGLADVENLLGKASITDYNQFFEDFCLAMYCDDLGLDPSFTGYDSSKHQFTNINLRAGTFGGLRGGSLSDGPVFSQLADIKGNSCRMFMYTQGNWGDIETTIQPSYSGGRFKTYVIYYSAEHLH